MNSGELTALSVMALSFALMFYVVYRERVLRLVEREKVVQDQIERVVYDERANMTDSYIFRSLWSLSHVTGRARALGYELTIYDCYKIIAKVKQDFTPERGITQFIIDMAIHSYVKSLKPVTILHCRRLKDTGERCQEQCYYIGSALRTCSQSQ